MHRMDREEKWRRAHARITAAGARPGRRAARRLHRFCTEAALVFVCVLIPVSAAAAPEAAAPPPAGRFESLILFLAFAAAAIGCTAAAAGVIAAGRSARQREHNAESQTKSAIAALDRAAASIKAAAAQQTEAADAARSHAGEAARAASRLVAASIQAESRLLHGARRAEDAALASETAARTACLHLDSLANLAEALPQATSAALERMEQQAAAWRDEALADMRRALQSAATTMQDRTADASGGVSDHLLGLVASIQQANNPNAADNPQLGSVVSLSLEAMENAARALAVDAAAAASREATLDESLNTLHAMHEAMQHLPGLTETLSSINEHLAATVAAAAEHTTHAGALAATASESAASIAALVDDLRATCTTLPQQTGILTDAGARLTACAEDVQKAVTIMLAESTAAKAALLTATDTLPAASAAARETILAAAQELTAAASQTRLENAITRLEALPAQTEDKAAAAGAAAIEAALRIGEAAERLARAAVAQDAAGARVMRAAQMVENALPPLRKTAEAPAKTARRLVSELNTETRQVLQAAENLAEAALAGSTSLPADIAAEAPVLLERIDCAIGRLRGAASALSIASDAAA